MGDIPLGCWINRYLQLVEAGIQGVDPLLLPYAAALPHFPRPFSPRPFASRLCEARF